MQPPGPILLVALAFAMAPGPSAAQNSQISLDGSLNGRMDVLTGEGTGPDYTISEDMGRRGGANLFHSFKDFSIATGHSATFTANPGEPALSNVIARVTGGQPSKIDGRLALDRTTIPGADFYLLNPRGVLFGGQSSLDVPASFYASTAHQLAFELGDPLDLLSTAAPELLNSAPPAAFGFFSDGTRAEVAFANPLPQTGTRDYAVAAGRTFSAVAGDVRVENNVILRAPSGRVQLAAMGSSAGEVPIDFATPLEELGAPESLGEVRIAGGAQLLAANADRNAPQGSVVIRGGRFELARCADPCTDTSFQAGSTVRAGDFAGAGRPSIDIAVARDVMIHGTDTLVRAEAGSRASGGVGILADTISVRDGAVVQTRADATAAGGPLVLAAREIHVSDDGTLSSVTNRQGPGGNIELSADLIEIAGGEVQSFAGAPGRGGDILVTTDSLRVVNGTIGAESSATGRGGDIQLRANTNHATIEIEGGLAQISTLSRIAAAPEPTLPGGAIRIGSEETPIGEVVIADGGLVSTATSGAQPGGAIDVFADTLEVEGNGLDATGAERPAALQTFMSSQAETAVGGSIFLEVGHLRVGASEPGGVPGIVAAFVAAGARAPGGSIDIVGDGVLLEQGGQISTTTLGVGRAGSIDVDLTGDFVARGSHVGDALEPSGVFARGGAGSSGDAGDIHVAARSIEVLDAAEISSRGLGSGSSGSIALQAGEAIRIVGRFQASNVSARGAIGGAGNVLLDAPRIELIDGGVADVSVTGGSDGGVLAIRGGDLLVSGESGTGIASSLIAESAGQGAARGIDIDVAGRVRVERGAQINSLARSEGTPGDIAVRAETIEFTGAETRGTAESTETSRVGAGSIHLEATRSIRISEGADVTVRSARGENAGTLSLIAPAIELLEGSLTADASAFGGNVEITADSLLLEKSSIVALSRGESAVGAGALAVIPSGTETPAGGNLTIEGGAVILNQATLNANGFGNANGGNISITADPWLRSGDSEITASSEFGLDGFVLVNTPYGEVTGDLAALPETFLDASSLLEEPCLARDAPSGSFAVQRLPRVAPPPDAPLSAEPAEAQQCEAPPAP